MQKNKVFCDIILNLHRKLVIFALLLDIIMVEQALKSVEKTNDAAEQGLAGALAVISSNAPAKMPALKQKSIKESVTYQNNRNNILATLQMAQVKFQPFGNPNILHDKMQIMVDKPLPEYNRAHAKAYSGLDLNDPNKQVVALVVESYFPYRSNVVSGLKGQNIPNMADLLDAGVVFIESFGENRMVLFYEKPMGEKLIDFLAKQKMSSYSEVIRLVVSPIAAVLMRLQAANIAHGAINPQNIYIQDGVLTLWDCAAEPCGYDQPDIYEPVERLVAKSGMRGEPNLISDIYALAILVLDCLGLIEGKKNFTHLQLYPAYIQKGAYAVVVDENKLPSQFNDLMRGVLCDNPLERWGLETILAFIGGKRFNLIPLNPPRDTARPLSFAGADYSSLRSAANAFFLNPELAIKTISDNKLSKWVDTLLQRNDDLREDIKKMQQRAERTPSKSRACDEIVAKTISTLDPFSAIRYKKMAVAATSLPQAFCESFKNGDLAGQLLLREMIDAELAGYWRDLHDNNARQLKWNPEEARLLLQNNAACFGIERVLYDLNPSLPCLSRNYLKYNSLSAKHMMLVLEGLAKEKSETDSLYDKHLISFLASRAGIKKDLPLGNFHGYAAFVSSNELKAIATLAIVQNKLKIESLPALSCWAALKIADLVEQFHGFEVRKAISRDLQAVLPKGNLLYLLKILQNSEYFGRDMGGHAAALQIFARNEIKIKQLRNKDKIENRANEIGEKIALSGGLLLLIFMFYVVGAKYLF
jgi:serine/threonine protein kinase